MGTICKPVTESLIGEPDVWESRLSGFERGRGTTMKRKTYCGTVAKADGNGENKPHPTVKGVSGLLTNDETKRQSRIVAVMVAVFAAVVAHGASLPSGGALAEVDLASDTAWTLSIDGGAVRPIKVPGRGWNSDLQEPRIDSMSGVKDFVVYSRTITIPKKEGGQVTQLRCGAVAHGCEVYLDGKKVGEHQGPQVPFEIDLTEAATLGKEQTLTVKAYHRRHYYREGSCDVAVGWDFVDGNDEVSHKEAKKWCNWAGNSKVAYGISRSIKLVVLPAVHVEEVFVKPSVAKKQLSCDVWIRNSTAKERKIKLGAGLSSWNNAKWDYPEMLALDVVIPAKGVTKVTLGPVAWELGSQSYWWPNIPFKEDYVATLHILNLKLSEGWTTWQRVPQRFGFVEHAEGPFYYTVNGVRVTGISDGTAEGQISYYDSYGSAAAFLPPSKPGTGCPETWKRYMRIGINMNRLHCSPPTTYMMEAADEVGFMLIPEAPIWGNGLSRFNPQYTPQTYMDMGRHCRNHPCVARYSLSNEVREKRDENWPWRAAIDAMLTVDDRHPLVFEIHGDKSDRVDGLKRGHARIIEHYTNVRVKGGDMIRGMGEHFWSTEMSDFAMGARVLRLNDWCYFAPWSWINYWPNFLEGMNHDLHAWKPNNHADRTDGVDGWGSPLVEFVQRCLHPYLVMDRTIEMWNPSYSPAWPSNRPLLAAGRDTTREIEVFNGGLFGNAMGLEWEVRWDSAQGEKVAAGRQEFTLEPGFHCTRRIVFKVPAVDKERTLFLVLRSLLDGTVMFAEDHVAYKVGTPDGKTVSDVFVGTDEVTQGNWKDKYGRAGYELVCKEVKLPPAVTCKWVGSESCWTNATADVRALWYFGNPPADRDRVAARRWYSPLMLSIDVGDIPTQVALYFLDWDKQARKQTIEVRSFDTVLDRQTIPFFEKGKYLIWNVKGRVDFLMIQDGIPPAVVSGVFFDPVK